MSGILSYEAGDPSESAEDLSNASGLERFRTIARVCSGNFLEMYDFMIFGYYAKDIGRVFFPQGSEFASLMASLMTFGAGFLMRPLGAIVLGGYIDRHGRRAGLLLTLGLMSLGTLSLAAMPAYATAGLIAPLVIVAGRLLQGFSAGAELGGVSVYLSEVATRGHRGFYVSWQSASQQVAVMFAALLGVMLTEMLSQRQRDEWGWRIPLIVGCLLIPFLLMVRRSLKETPKFAARRRPEAGEMLRSLGAHWRRVVVGMLLVMMTTVTFYTITAYTPTFGKSALKLSERGSLIVTLCVGASNLFWLPAMGALSDKIGRRGLLLGCTALTLVSSYPAMHYLAAEPSFGRLLGVELWLSFLYGSYNGAMVVYLTEIMPPEVKTAGFSLAYSLATAVGGFTPAICTGLIHATGNAAMPGVCVGVAAACGFGAALVGRPYRMETGVWLPSRNE